MPKTSCPSAARVFTAALLALSVAIVPAAAPSLRAAEAGEEKAAAVTPGSQVSMQEMMQRARRYIQPGEQHEWLERFLGEWETETRLRLPGQELEPDRGTSRGTWLIEGRWLKLEGRGTLMGQPFETFHILGYDNFKQSFVVAGVSSADTAMLTSEGDIDPRTGSLITYGTLDEYLTGEHDKMVKYAWRFPDDDTPNNDTIVLEVHDLPIGETDTEVIHMTFRRKQPAGEGG